MNLIFLGPPGAGKGTQAKKLCAELGIPHISTGDILRAAVQKGTELGKKAGPLMAEGKLVPDELVQGIVQERLQEADARKGFILDGFPRTVPQAENLEASLAKSGRKIDAVICLDVPDAVIVERIAGRRSCPTCGTVYNVTATPPKRMGFCDKDNTGLVQRDDDTEPKVKARLEAYARQTAPLKARYQEQGILKKVEGVGSPDGILADIRKALGK